jgi:cysteine desulfurase
VGFLYVRSKRPKVKLVKQIHGGAQEFSFRAGTLANYQIFALGAACKEMFAKKEQNIEHVRQMRDQFLKVISQIKDIKINTNLDGSYPGILSITFLGIKGEALLAMLDGVCLSMGSACNSQAVEPSYVLTEIGLTSDEAEATIRVSFGLQTTQQEVMQVAFSIKKQVELLRALSPQGEANV